MKLRALLSTLLVIALCSYSWAGAKVKVVYIYNNTVSDVDTFPNWFNLDPASDNVPGVSTERTYRELLKGKKGKTVIVAVIDSGVEVDHEDLKDVIWVNKGEIADNGKDDDENGYIDDVHGWNFIGGKGGTHVGDDTYEITRLYVKYTEKFGKSDGTKLSKADAKEYAEYTAIKKKFEETLAEATANFQRYEGIYNSYIENIAIVEKALGRKDNITYEDIKGLKAEVEGVEGAQKFFEQWEGRGVPLEALSGLKGAVDYYGDQVKYAYNVEFNPRTVVGDDYNNLTEKYYGNNSYEGPDASHGTHVAGIIAATRGNNIGIDGVADNVQIMVLRVVPNGDERDKDVANAIRYAADNGASVVNMSFGKAYSWNKQVVDEAVQYAKKKDVLLVHAAGNSSLDTDIENNFPNDKYEKTGLFKPKEANNWLEIGASSWEKDKVANFSNYAVENVDVFAPGVQLNSCVPGSEYQAMSGTSMASPVVAGVAAVIRSYFPTLTAEQVRDVIMESAVKSDAKYNKPGSDKEQVTLSELCKTGGMVNLYEAVKLAEKTAGKKKVEEDIRP
jgi:cell wall-associated protease